LVEILLSVKQLGSGSDAVIFGDSSGPQLFAHVITVAISRLDVTWHLYYDL